MAVKRFIKKEATLCAAFVAAIVSCFFIPLDASYIGYLDCHTIALLYCLMVVVSGLRSAGVFDALARLLCARAHSVRAMGFVLVALCFVSSMLITNDVALLTFVPFAVVVLGLSGQTKALALTVVLQTIAANLGSMLTPVGNPQNIYIYSYYNMSAVDFFGATAPVWLIAAALLALCCLLLPQTPLAPDMRAGAPCDRKALAVYAILLAACMLVVFRVLAWPYMLIIVIATLAVFNRKMLLHADFLLLLTFVCFFVFAGNLARIGGVNELLRSLLNGHELLVGAGASQLISNVPSAILLSGFTENARALLLGVDIGGLGTPVASLASLIALKLYSSSASADTPRFMRLFLILNFALLAVLLAAGSFFC